MSRRTYSGRVCGEDDILLDWVQVTMDPSGHEANPPPTYIAELPRLEVQFYCGWKVKFLWLSLYPVSTQESRLDY